LAGKHQKCSLTGKRKSIVALAVLPPRPGPDWTVCSSRERCGYKCRERPALSGSALSLLQVDSSTDRVKVADGLETFPSTSGYQKKRSDASLPRGKKKLPYSSRLGCGNVKDPFFEKKSGQGIAP